MNTKSKRIIAFIIDAFTISLLVSIINFISSFLKNGADGQSVNIILSFGSSLILYLVYFIIFDLLKNGKTLGKMILDIKVVNKNTSGALSKDDLIKRSLLKTVSVLVLPIAVLLFLFNNQFTIQDYYTDSETISE